MRFMKLFLVAAIAVFASLILIAASHRVNDELNAAADAAAFLSLNPPHIRLEKKVAAMSVEEKIGQMLMVAIPGTVESAVCAISQDCVKV